MDKFEHYKAKAMKGLADAKAKKLVDEDAMPFVDEINEKDDYFTSSSCYGRIYLIDLPSRKKNESLFIEKHHRPVTFTEMKRGLDEHDGKIWFRQEAFILHISCRDVESARKALEAKTRAGIKRGGIFNIKDGRVQIEIEGTQKIDCPVKDGKKMLVSDEYFNYLIELANDKIENNIKDWERLRSEFRKI